MIALTIYSRPDCHLCDEMKAVVRRVAGAAGQTTIEEVDISGNAGLEALYGLEVPVLLVNGVKAAKYRIGERELARMLAGRGASGGGAG